MSIYKASIGSDSEIQSRIYERLTGRLPTQGGFQAELFRGQNFYLDFDKLVLRDELGQKEFVLPRSAPDGNYTDDLVVTGKNIFRKFLAGSQTQFRAADGYAIVGHTELRDASGAALSLLIFDNFVGGAHTQGKQVPSSLPLESDGTGNRVQVQVIEDNRPQTFAVFGQAPM
jgi:hypothetical protein